MPGRDPHELLVEGFHGIRDKAALGWAALDTKFERFALAAIAASINGRGQRVAHLEYPPRRDLVILKEPLPVRPGRHLDWTQGEIAIRYEAKAGQLFDFADGQKTAPEYLGGLLNRDLAAPDAADVAGLFFISDAREPNCHLKYYRGFGGDLAGALRTLEKHVTNGRLVACETIDCGVLGGTELKIHMVIFDQADRLRTAPVDVDALLASLGMESVGDLPED